MLTTDDLLLPQAPNAAAYRGRVRYASLGEEDDLKSDLTASTTSSTDLDEFVEEEDTGVRRVALFVVLLVISCVTATVYTREHSKDPPLAGDSRIETGNWTGWVAVVGAVLVFGSYGVLIKSPVMQEAAVDAMTFQLYYSVGVSLASLLVLFYEPTLDVNKWGFIGATLWVFASLFAYVAIYNVGYAVGLSTWAGVTIIVSFLWGSIVFHQQVHSIGQAAVAIAVLILGICGVASCSTGAPDQLWATIRGDKKTQLLKTDGVVRYGAIGSPHRTEAVGWTHETVNMVPFSDLEGGDDDDGPSRLVPVLVGIASAVVVGMLNGSLMVPLHYDQRERERAGHTKNNSLAYVANLAVGIISVTMGMFALYVFHRCAAGRKIHLHFRLACPRGVLTGLFWACGNFCAVVATEYLGDTLGFPLTQIAICVSGLWGIFYFNEIRGTPAVTLFVLSCVTILGGAGLLAVTTR